MATIAVGDIHGNLAALQDLLAQLKPELHDGDVVVLLGDYIDRGADSRGCIDAVLEFKQSTRAEVVCLRGNHEDWMLRTRVNYRKHSWLFGMDALVTVGSYSTDAVQTIREAMASAGAELFTGDVELPYAAFFDILPPAHHAFFDRLALSIQTPHCVCSHGGVDTRIAALRDQPAESLMWGGGTFPEGYTGELPLIYGHWNNADIDAQGWPQPVIVGNTIGIDTIKHGVLTAIRMPDRQVFQSARYQLKDATE